MESTTPNNPEYDYLAYHIVPVDEEGTLIQFQDRPAGNDCFELPRYLYYEKVKPLEKN